MKQLKQEILSWPMTRFHNKNHSDFKNDEVWSEFIEKVWDQVEDGLGTGYLYWGNTLRAENWMRYVE